MASSPGKDLRRRFAISDEILKRPSVSCSSNSQLLQLDLETLEMIYSNIDHPRWQISFALSCKALACVARQNDLAQAYFSAFRKHRAYQLPQLLRDLRPLMPDSLQLCRGCWKYLPKQRQWKDKQGRDITKLRRVDWMWAVKSWLGGYGICPTCQIPANYDDSTGWLQCWPEGFVRMVMVSQGKQQF